MIFFKYSFSPVLISHHLNPVLKVEQIATDLNEKALTPEQFANLRTSQHPQVVVQRNRLRLLIGQRLIVDSAARAGKRLIAYRCQDSFRIHKKGHLLPVTKEISNMLDGLQANKTGLMPTVSFFFEGMKKMFTANEGLNIGYVKNNTCTCVRLMLDPREPPDDGSGELWMLRYHPIAEIVRPDIIDVGATILPDYPGCIAIVPIASPQGFKLALPQPMSLIPGGEKVSTVTIHRFGMAMDTADVVTDQWTQGTSFLQCTFITHLTPTDTGGPTKCPSTKAPPGYYTPLTPSAN